jgi:hypothetical protein
MVSIVFHLYSFQEWQELRGNRSDRHWMLGFYYALGDGIILSPMLMVWRATVSS